MRLKPQRRVVLEMEILFYPVVAVVQIYSSSLYALSDLSIHQPPALNALLLLTSLLTRDDGAHVFEDCDGEEMLGKREFEHLHTHIHTGITLWFCFVSCAHHGLRGIRWGQSS